MELQIISHEQYAKACKGYEYFYNSREFHELNKDKVDEIVYMVFVEGKNKLALCAGISGGILKVPYSAPFGNFEVLQEHIKLEDIDSALQLLSQYAQERQLDKLFFRLPPFCYNENFISKLQNCFIRQGFEMETCDLNYQFYIESIERYEESLKRNAKKNLNRARQSKFMFVHCDKEAERKSAYEIIALNRSRKGYPLRMTYEQIANTVQYTPYDFFILYEGNVGVASAVVFQVNRTCYQVIYWGDIGGYEEKRPMNYLAYKIYEYYLNKGIRLLDIGPSTEDGIPNYGLCDYKESIGCSVSTKYTYIKKL